MAITLLQAANISYNEGKERLSDIQTQFALNSSVLSVLPIEPINGSILEVPIEDKLPNVGIRNYNQGFGQVSMETRTEKNGTSMIGGDITIDRAMIREMGETLRTANESAAIRSMALSFDRYFIQGSPDINPAEFAGLRKRTETAGTQVIDAGSTSGGDALSLSKLDEVYELVRNPTHWIMSLKMRTLLTTASRNSSVTGYLTHSVDELGRRVTLYAGLPILAMNEDNQGQQIMPFTEAAPGGGSPVCTSIYLVSLTPSGLIGIESQPMEVRDLGEGQSAPQMITRVDWRIGIAPLSPKSIARVRGIKNAPIVA